MDRIQNKLLELLSEIDEICEEIQTGYTLDAHTAAMAQATGGFAQGNYNVTICMTLRDFDLFSGYLEEHPRENRVLEGMHNNNRFPGFFFRYVDTGTTFYNYNVGTSYQYNGLHVTIEVLRYFSGSSKKLALLEKGFANNNYRYKKWMKLSNKMNRFKVWLKIAGRRERASKNLYSRLHHAYTIDRPFVTFYSQVNRSNFKVTKYPSYLYSRRVRMPFEDKMIYMASDLELQYRLVTGKQLINYVPVTDTHGLSTLISAEVPFSEHDFSEKTRKQILRKRQGIWLTDQMHGTVTYIMNKDWAVMKCVSANLDMKAKYLPMKEELISMYSNEEFELLNEAFGEYDASIRYYYNRLKMTLYFDKEIFDIYLACLENNNEYAFAKRIVRKIPDVWKQKR